MSKKIHWRRISAALSVLALTPVVGLWGVLAALPEAQTRDLPGSVDCEAGALLDLGLFIEASECNTWTQPTELIASYKLARDRLEVLEQEAVGSAAPERAMEAVAYWKVGTRLERNGDVLNVGVGAAMGTLASQVVEVALEQGSWTDEELVDLERELKRIGADAIDPLALGTRYQAAARDLTWEAFITGSWLHVAFNVYELSTLPEAFERIAAVGPSPEARMALREELDQPAAGAVIHVVLDSDAVRSRAIALAAAAVTRQYVSRHGACPDRLDGLLRARPAPKVTWDPHSCVLVLQDHPDRQPQVYGPFGGS